MTFAEVRQALRDPKATLESTTEMDPMKGCAYLVSKRAPDALGVMFDDARVVRIDVYKPGIKTASGAGVGDTEDRIKQLYPGRITVEPHHYLGDEGHYLRYEAADAADRGLGMVFETERNKVTSLRVGKLNAVSLVEGCS